MANYDGSIRVGTKIETKEAERELKSLESSISKTANKIASLRSKMDALKDVKLPTQQYADLDKELSKLGAEYDKIAERQQKFLSTGGKESSSTYKRMEYDLEKLDQRQDEVIAKMKELEESGKAFTLGSNTEEYAQMTAQMEQLRSSMQADQQRTAEIQASLVAEEQRLTDIKANAVMSDQKMVNLLERRKQLTQEIAEMERAGLGYGYEKYNAAQQEISSINNQIKEYSSNLKKVPDQFSNVKKSAKKAFDAISSGTKKSSGLLSTFTSRLKGLMISLLIFNLIRKAFNSMISGIKQGFSNFMNYSSDFANSVQSMKNAMSTLGNQFAAAFAPIAQMVIPWLTKLINAISTAMTYVAQFIAILGGKSTFTRAKQVQDGYNKSLGGTAAAAKKAYGALAKFDDLDVLQKKEEDSDIGGGVADAVGDLFEEVPVDSKFKDWLDGILEKLKPILHYLKKLKDAFVKGFLDGLGDWEYRLDIIKKGLKQIMDALIDIWTDPAVLAAADAWLQSLMYMFGSFVGAVASIGLTIAAAFIGGLGKYMSENVDRIKKFLISAFDIGTEINNLLASLFQSVAYIFEAFASESGIRFVAALIGSIADMSMGIIELALSLGRDILSMLILPITENADEFKVALEGLLATGANALEGFKTMIDSIFDNLNTVYEEHFKPFFDSIANGISHLVSVFLEVWNDTVSPILQNIGLRIGELLANYIAPFVNSVVEFIGNLATILQSLWEGILLPIVEWVITYAVPVMAEVINMFVETIITIIEWITSALTTFMDFVNGTLVPLWQASWDLSIEIFQKFSDFCKNHSEIIKLLFTGLFGKIVELINGKWKDGWEKAKEIFDTFKTKVNDVIGNLREVIQSFFDWVAEMVAGVLETLNSIGSAISGFVSGIGDKISSVFTFSVEPDFKVPVTYVPTANKLLNDIPHLASGSVIRGGNPFLAMLGDQPHGQTNIEAPLSTIKQAVREELSDLNYGGGLNPTISLNVNGEEFARLTLNDILSEMSRQGYDVDVLGVT